MGSQDGKLDDGVGSRNLGMGSRDGISGWDLRMGHDLGISGWDLGMGSGHGKGMMGLGGTGEG